MARTIIIGDIQGCAHEFGDLLDRLALSDEDTVILVGDVIAKGPYSGDALALARQVGAQSVRGNHEDRLLRWRKSSARRRGAHKNAELAAISMDIGDAGWEQITQMPVWLKLEHHHGLVVHAGLEPGTPIEQQAEKTLLHVRYLDPAGRAVSKREPRGALWGEHYQGPPHVFFGHHALPEPQLHFWATGIDTGCVYGHALSALVLTNDQPIPHEADAQAAAIVSVPARQVYVPIQDKSC